MRFPPTRIAWLVAGLLIACRVPPAWAQAADPDPARFAKEIAAFGLADTKTPPPAHPIVFVGSSTIRMWPTTERFPGLPVLNRGFGGSHISDVNHYVDVTVLKYAPDVVVFYAGDNDIAEGKAPRRVLEDYQRFVDRVRAARTQTQIIFIAIKPSPLRWALWPTVREANALIKTYSESRPGLHYVDIVPLMLGPDGQPLPHLFLADRLHMTPAGYDLWTPVLAKSIARVRALVAPTPASRP